MTGGDGAGLITLGAPWAICVCFTSPSVPSASVSEILLALKGLTGTIDFQVVDITKPRDPALLAKTPGTTAFAVPSRREAGVLRESLVLMQYVEDRFPEPRVAAVGPFARGVRT